MARGVDVVHRRRSLVRGVRRGRGLRRVVVRARADRRRWRACAGVPRTIRAGCALARGTAQRSAGNGAVMCIAPVIVPHLAHQRHARQPHHCRDRRHHGRRAARACGLPLRWVDGLLGRTREDDDGRVFELIDRALDVRRRVFRHPRRELVSRFGVAVRVHVVRRVPFVFRAGANCVIPIEPSLSRRQVSSWPTARGGTGGHERTRGQG